MAIGIGVDPTVRYRVILKTQRESMLLLSITTHHDYLAHYNNNERRG